MRSRWMVLLVLILALVACGGNGDEDNGSASEVPEDNVSAGSPTVTATIDTARELPPEIDIDPAARQLTLTAQPSATGGGLVTSTASNTPRSGSGAATLPPARVEPTETRPPAQVVPTRTPQPTTTPTPTFKPTNKPVGSCEGFAPDHDSNAQSETVQRGSSATVYWFPPQDADDVSYLVRIYNSRGGIVLETETTEAFFEIPPDITNTPFDPIIGWEVRVLVGGVDLRCIPIGNEITLQGAQS